MKFTEAQLRAYTKYNSSDKKKALDKRYRENNKQSCKESSAKYYAKNKKEIAKRFKLYSQTKKGKASIKKHNEKGRKNGKANERYNERYKTDLNFKIKTCLRARQIGALRDYVSGKHNRTMTSTGCTVEFFKQHIAKQFLPGMTWDNWGTIWQIDHIKPCAAFDLTKREEQLKCFHYSNQRPLWSLENNLKADSYEHNEQHERMLSKIG